jgi:hypothetical protein
MGNILGQYVVPYGAADDLAFAKEVNSYFYESIDPQRKS